MLLSRLVQFAAIVLMTQASGAREDAARLARAAVIEKTGADADLVRVSRVTETEWTDAGLGCGEPGEAYAQVLVPGHHVVIRVGPKRYDVHVGGGRAVLCDYLKSGARPGPHPEPKAPPDADKAPIALPEDPGLRKLVDQARADLAERIAVDATAIELVTLEEVVWSDRSLGCPEPGMRYPQIPEDGLLIELLAGGRLYEYHSGGTKDPFLCETPSSK